MLSESVVTQETALSRLKAMPIDSELPDFGEMLKDADLSNYPNHITFYNPNFKQKMLSDDYLEYRRKWVENAKTYTVGDFPLHLDVEVTNSCNLRCTMCFVDFSIDTGKFVDINLVKKVIDEGSKRGLASIKFNYRGEPTLHKDLVEMVKYAKDNGILEVAFNTNATRLTRERSEGLILAGLDKMIVSMDGVTPEIYNSIRKGAKFDKVLANVLNFLEIREELGRDNPFVKVQMVCMQENKEEVQKFVTFWRDKADQIGLIRFRKAREEIADQTIAEYNQFAKPCHQLYQRMIVGCDGVVTMCCGDYRRDLALGDANTTSIAEIWKGPKMSSVRKLHEAERYDEVAPCKTCSINRHDKGTEWDWFKELAAN